MKTIRDVRKWLTSLEQSIEDRRLLDQLRDMQIITRNVERDLRDLFTERNKLIAEVEELRKEIETLKKRS
ncbi:MAG: hypothetical protein HKP52_03525 [Desulfofustis sp.]|nr:hypothetical protein [Desulfofustis sp.]NNF45621.1 hypothetical protein [Desulfofustis sp.]NNK13286.1 hypothetical protein [Desulfofustis sp.]NNK57106.1 hypothetical protein [Desulfofustis sp.]